MIDSEVRFIMSGELEAKLQAVESILGPKAAGMGYAELIATIAELSQQQMVEIKFGKKRATTKERDI